MINFHEQQLKELAENINKFVVYRGITRDPLFDQFYRLLLLAAEGQTASFELQGLFYEICAQLLERASKEGSEGSLWKNYLVRLTAGDVNVFSRACACFSTGGEKGSIFRAALCDIDILKKLFNFDFRLLGNWVDREILNVIENFHPETQNRTSSADSIFKEKTAGLRMVFSQDISSEELALALSEFYRISGCGVYNRFTSFRWDPDEGIKGISFPDPILLDNLIGYEQQKDIIIKNTEAFVEGKRANNLLLYGDRGTGKSSAIKALVNKYGSRGLRLVEVPRNQLFRLMDVVRIVREEPQRFLIFIDDLSFEGSETEYKYLKALMEGGVESMPDNVLIYATSNRRHLVQETWQDRNDAGGEIRTGDSMAEKLSLSDRFGLTVVFTSPDQEEYISIVEGLARQYGIKIPLSELRERALRWERWYNGRSGRTARQFIFSLSSGLQPKK